MSFDNKEVVTLTGNQIAYSRFLEDQRHNLWYEKHQEDTLAEVTRHNVVMESQGWSSIAETKRHNLVSEQLGFKQFQESARHNVAMEQLSRMRNEQDARYQSANIALGYAKNPWALLTDPEGLQRLIEKYSDVFSSSSGHKTNDPTFDRFISWAQLLPGGNTLLSASQEFYDEHGKTIQQFYREFLAKANSNPVNYWGKYNAHILSFFGINGNLEPLFHSIFPE